MHLTQIHVQSIHRVNKFVDFRWELQLYKESDNESSTLTIQIQIQLQIIYKRISVEISQYEICQEPEVTMW